MLGPANLGSSFIISPEPETTPPQQSSKAFVLTQACLVWTPADHSLTEAVSQHSRVRYRKHIWKHMEKHKHKHILSACRSLVLHLYSDRQISPEYRRRSVELRFFSHEDIYTCCRWKCGNKYSVLEWWNTFVLFCEMESLIKQRKFAKKIIAYDVNSS